MTIIADHVSGFEAYNTTTFVDQGWRRQSSDSSVLIGSGHAIVAAMDTGNALSLPSGAGIKRHTITSDSTNPYLCAAFARTSATSRRIFSANYVGLGIGMFITWKADGTFEVFNRSGVSQGVTAAYASLSHRYYLQVAWSASTSSENLKFYVDGVLDKTFTADWRGGGINTAGLTEWDICASDASTATTGADIVIDDVYLLHETGGFTPVVFPNMRVQALIPTSDSSVALTPNTGASNYAVVDDVPPDTTDYLESLVVTGSSTRTDLYSWAAPTNTNTSDTMYAMSVYANASGSTVADDRLQLRTNFAANTPETQTVANFNLNGSLSNSAIFLYSCPVALPIASLSSGGGGISISSFLANYTFGPRIVRSGTVTTSSKTYSFVMEIAVKYFVQQGGWRLGSLRMD